MICPKTTFDCISCDTECMLVKRQEKGDPFRRGNELRTCEAEQEILDDSGRAIAHEFSQH
jgi:hypothetical protein